MWDPVLNCSDPSQGCGRAQNLELHLLQGKSASAWASDLTSSSAKWGQEKYLLQCFGGLQKTVRCKAPGQLPGTHAVLGKYRL